MNFNKQDIDAIETLGYTEEEARFLYLVAVHSGYFVPRQFLNFSGTKRSNKFTAKLESRGHVTWREYDRIGEVYHLFSRTLYRLIDKENLRYPRRHSLEFIRTRLLSLDYVLANLDFDYLPTEPEKIAFFSETLGIPRTALPAKICHGGPRCDPTVHYFDDKFPLFLDRRGSSSTPTITLSYVAPGHPPLARFVKHLRAYLPLLRQLEGFCFLYIADTAIRFVPAEKCFSSLVRSVLEANMSGDILRYFGLRNAWESKKYGLLSVSDVEWLKEAKHRFHADCYESSYHAWASGALSEQDLRHQFEQLHPCCHVSFQTFLADSSSLDALPAGLPSR
jgi:hypothetical protein